MGDFLVSDFLSAFAVAFFELSRIHEEGLRERARFRLALVEGLGVLLLAL